MHRPNTLLIEYVTDKEKDSHWKFLFQLENIISPYQHFFEDSTAKAWILLNLLRSNHKSPILVTCIYNCQYAITKNAKKLWMTILHF